MTKLYEILPVEADLRKESGDRLKALIALFDHPEMLMGMDTSYHKILESEPELSKEVKELAHTVNDELDVLWETFGSYVDVSVQKEMSNTHTSADVLLDGEAFLSGLSATSLLNLESRLDELRKVYESIPTLDPAERWTFDEGQGRFVSYPREQYRTKKVPRSFVAYEATPEHPAQVQTYNEDVPAYKVERILFSGALTQADKRERLERLSKLQLAVKKARQRANDVEIESVNVADKIFNYINGN